MGILGYLDGILSIGGSVFLFLELYFSIEGIFYGS
jgi:hypothetical protein